MKNRRSWGGRPVPLSGRSGSMREGDVDEAVLECSLEELREFLEADLVDVPIDREFKETLRHRLWDMVQTRNRIRGVGTKEN